MRDMRISLVCPKHSTSLQFTVMTKKNSTVFTDEEKLARKVNPKTCELISDNINITETD